MKINILKNQILYCLEHYPETRNSDTKLTSCIWVNYYREYLCEMNGEFQVSLKNLYALPTQDDVKRLRAKIQNVNKLFPPTNEKVALKRHWQEEEWRKALGYNPELRTI